MNYSIKEYMKFKQMFYMPIFSLFFINCNQHKKPIEERFFYQKDTRDIVQFFLAIIMSP
jgi:hypothetical protein